MARLLTPLFEKTTIDDDSRERLRAAHARGIVVYTLRATKVVDPAFIAFVSERLGLARPTWIHDAQTSTPESLVDSVHKGEAAILFLRPSSALAMVPARSGGGHVEGLLALQRAIDTPISLLPVALLFGRQPVDLRRTIIDSIFGHRDAPGALRELAGFLWHHADTRFHVGEPVDLRAVLERGLAPNDRTLAKKIRWSILHHLSREQQLRTGPIHRGAARTAQNVLHDRTLRDYIVAEADKGRAIAEVEREAAGILRTIAADMNHTWLAVLDVVLDRVWKRIYADIVLDLEGLAKVRRAARKGAVVLVPSHKSHIDYLLLSQLFFKEGLIPPHIAAGDNLDFPPMGTLMRHAGAFFMKRSFRGDRLYGVVFAAYVRRLLREGHTLEFFIEGGRSRTGRLLAPRLGMLGMCVDPILDGSIHDVSFVPVHIGYERIVEAEAYRNELRGRKKTKETIFALAGSLGKIFRSKYGRVHIDFDDPISVRVFAASRGIALPSRAEIRDSDDIAADTRRDLASKLGHRIVHGINAVTRVTPTNLLALAILETTRRQVSATELYARAFQLLSNLVDYGARLSAALAPGTREDALHEALDQMAKDEMLRLSLANDGSTLIHIGDDTRRALDYYKNNILHFLVPASIVSLALLEQGGRDVPLAMVASSAHAISKHLKFEFSFRVDRVFEENFMHAADVMLRRHAIVRSGESKAETWSITPSARAECVTLASLSTPIWECYLAALDFTSALASGPMKERDFLDGVFLEAERYVDHGMITRPEGVSLVTVENAMKLLLDFDVLGREGGRLFLRDASMRDRLVRSLEAHLGAVAIEGAADDAPTGAAPVRDDNSAAT